MSTPRVPTAEKMRLQRNGRTAHETTQDRVQMEEPVEKTLSDETSKATPGTRAAHSGKGGLVGQSDVGQRSVRNSQPRRIDLYRPFPVERLPPCMACFVQQTANALGCDPAHVALPALSVMTRVPFL